MVTAIAVMMDVVLLLAAIIVVSYIAMIYNSLVRLKNNIELAWANIDVLLKQRFDELPNVIATVKGYAKYEKDTLKEITRLRTSFASANSIADKAGASRDISKLFASVFAVAEGYPKLRASENFLSLQKRISGLEDAIADRREFYNDSVNTYNIRIEQFPYNIFARLFKYTAKELFVAKDEERQPFKASV